MYMQLLIKNLRYERNNHILRGTLQLLPQLHHPHRQQFPFLFLHLTAVLNRLTLYDRAVMYMQHRDIDFLVLLVIPEYIYVARSRIGDNRLAFELF